MADSGFNQLSSKILKAAISVHNGLGPGLLESVYGRCMVIELEKLGLKIESGVCVPITYGGRTIADEGWVPWLGWCFQLLSRQKSRGLRRRRCRNNER
jgi:hypothetical protein